MKVSSPKQAAAQPRAAPKVTGSPLDRRRQSPELGDSRSKAASHVHVESPGPQDRRLAALRRGVKLMFLRATPAQAAALDEWLIEPAEFPRKMISCDDCRRPTGKNSVIVKTRLLCRECAKAKVGPRKLAYQLGWRDAEKWSAENLGRRPRLSVAGLQTLRIRPGMARTGPRFRIA